MNMCVGLFFKQTSLFELYTCENVIDLTIENKKIVRYSTFCWNTLLVYLSFMQNYVDLTSAIL